MTDEPILSTKEQIGEFDAIESAKPDEPLFTLQGGDPLAGATILYWADLARTAARAETDPDRYDKLMRKATNAEQVAWAFTEYQRGELAAEQQKKVDLAADQFANDRSVVLARICDRLNNAVFEALAAADRLFELQFIRETGKLRYASEILRNVSKKIEPRRQLQDRKPTDG